MPARRSPRRRGSSCSPGRCSRSRSTCCTADWCAEPGLGLPPGAFGRGLLGVTPLLLRDGLLEGLPGTERGDHARGDVDRDVRLPWVPRGARTAATLLEGPEADEGDALPL